MSTWVLKLSQLCPNFLLNPNMQVLYLLQQKGDVMLAFNFLLFVLSFTGWKLHVKNTLEENEGYL